MFHNTFFLVNMGVLWQTADEQGITFKERDHAAHLKNNKGL
jgi:hypothetical protein